MHSCLFLFLLGSSLLGELFFSGLGNFYDLGSFWQAYVILEAGGQQRARVPVFLFRFYLAPSKFARKLRSLKLKALILGDAVK